MAHRRRRPSSRPTWRRTAAAKISPGSACVHPGSNPGTRYQPTPLPRYCLIVSGVDPGRTHSLTGTRSCFPSLPALAHTTQARKRRRKGSAVAASRGRTQAERRRRAHTKPYTHTRSAFTSQHLLWTTLRRHAPRRGKLI